MQDLSLHILDIVENSLNAKATKIEITINEDTKRNILLIKIKDNGKGLDKQTITKVKDPFYSSKKNRRIGLGIPLLAQAAKESNGLINIKSKKGKGTTITASFIYDHIDRKPIGDMSKTILALVTSKGGKIDIIYNHKKNGRNFLFDTRDIKKQLKGITITNPEILILLKKNIKEGLEDIYNNKRTAK